MQRIWMMVHVVFKRGMILNYAFVLVPEQILDETHLGPCRAARRCRDRDVLPPKAVAAGIVGDDAQRVTIVRLERIAEQKRAEEIAGLGRIYIAGLADARVLERDGEWHTHHHFRSLKRPLFHKAKMKVASASCYLWRIAGQYSSTTAVFLSTSHASHNFVSASNSAF